MSTLYVPDVHGRTGTFVMPNLPTGPYRLEASLQGFRTYAQTGIVLQVGATPTINVTLAVGNLAETVAVVGAAPLVDVRSAGISDVVDQERIVELPLQGCRSATRPCARLPRAGAFRVSSTRSGSWLTVLSGRDNAFNGMANQRVDQVSNDVYGAKTLTSYLNPAAFAQPAPGALATTCATASRGLDSGRSTWRCRGSCRAAGTFGRITSTTGDPRIMQFGIKYGF